MCRTLFVALTSKMRQDGAQLGKECYVPLSSFTIALTALRIS